MQSADLPDCLDLLRLVWCPDDVVNGRVQPAAFKKNDLKGGAHFVSVDRVDLLIAAAVRRIAATQKARAIPQAQLNRDEAFATRLNTGALREARIDELAPFAVRSEPIEDEDIEKCNPAHCGVANVSNKTSKAYLLMLQTKLASLTFETKTLESALSEIENIQSA